jgi:hypothetical protein
MDPSASLQPSAGLLPLICLKRWPSLRSPIRPVGPSEGWGSNLTARQFRCVRYIELGTQSIHICLGHHERLVWRAHPAVLNPPAPLFCYSGTDQGVAVRAGARGKL